MKDEVLKYIKVIIGSILFSLGIYFFITPSGLNSGGVVGIAQILNIVLRPLNPNPDSFDLTGIMNMLLNVPLYILALKSISKSFCLRTLISIIIQMITLSLLPLRTEAIMPDMLSNCVFGALMSGVGVGLCLQSSSCAGGIDILGVYFSKTKPNFSVGKLSIILNFFVFAIFAYIVNLQNALYSIIFVAIMYFVGDKVHYQNINMSAMIFTQNENLKKEIMRITGRGVTCWKGQGVYTGQEKDILVVALNKYEIRRLEKAIKTVDPHAFMILSEGQKISGGFEKRL